LRSTTWGWLRPLAREIALALALTVCPLLRTGAHASPAEAPVTGATPAASSPARAPLATKTIDAWLGTHRAAVETGLELRKAARRLARELRNAGWTDAEIPPYKAMEQLAQPSQPLPQASEDELLALTVKYEDLASPTKLEALARARADLDALDAQGPELSAEQHALFEQNLGYSRFVSEPHVSVAAFVMQMRKDLFDPADHESISKGIHKVRDTLNSSIRANSVIESLEVMRRAYELRQERPILDLLSSTWRQQGSPNQDLASFPLALTNDYRNLINIRLLFFPGVVSERNGESSIGFYWSRRAVIARTSQYWVLEEKYATFVFRKEEGKLKLVRCEGDLPFGLTDRFGVLTLTEGTLDNTPITHPIKVERGVITSGGMQSQVRSGTTAINGSVFGGYFQFANGQSGANNATGPNVGDLLFFYSGSTAPITMKIRPVQGAAFIGGVQVLASTNLAAVKSVPTSGYSTATVDTKILATTRNVIAVQTSDGRYAKMQILNVTPSGLGFSILFDWSYQPDSTPNFP
jgi:hypothetical protein